MDAQALGPKAVIVHRALRDGIGAGEFPADARLPTQDELCSRFNVSRNTVKKALRQLEQDGFVTREPRRGSRVRAPTEARHRIISVMYSTQGDGLPEINREVLSRHCALSLYCQAQAEWDPDLESSFLNTVRRQRHLALLAFCSPFPSSNTETLRLMDREGIRVVHMQPFGEEPPEQSFLMPDYRRAGYAAVARLMTLGYRRVLFVGMKDSGPFMRWQRQGALDALRDLRGEEPVSRSLAVSVQDANWFDIEGRSPLHQGEADRLAESVQREGDSVGLVCSTVCAADVMRRLLVLNGALSEPAQVGLVSIETTVETERPDLDRLVFDPLALYRRAIELVTAPDFLGIHELVPPRLVPRQSAERRGSNTQQTTMGPAASLG